MGEPKIQVTMDDECLFSAFCCNEATLFKPAFDTSMLGCMSSNLMCCTYSKSAACICPAHQAYKGLVDDRDDVICATQMLQELVKPLCLTGEKPVCKGSMKGCCCSNRLAYPCDKDIFPGFGTCFLRCCNCGPFGFAPKCCVKKQPLDDAAFGGFDVEYAEAKYDEEYILAACCCCIMSAYNPATYVDAFGMEMKGVFCCNETDIKSNMLPKKVDGYDIMIEQVGRVLCVKPTTCLKGTSRNMFTLTKCAIPCDDEVPFAIGACGFVMGTPPKGFKTPAYKEYLFKPIEKSSETTTGAAPKAEEIVR